MTGKDRLRVAKALESARVDVIEAGFPAASPGVAASVAEIALQVNDSVVCAFARIHPADIDAAWTAVRSAKQPRIHTCIATSDEHIRVKLRSTRDDVLESIDRNVRRAASYTTTQFAAEDATRSDREFLIRAFETAARAGATIVTIPDTVGYMQPAEFGDLVQFVKERLPDGVLLSVHCHDDLGLAVANTLEAIRHGADEVQVTVNGIGERAGNCSLEEVAVALRVRADFYGVELRFITERIAELSDLVARATSIPLAKNKAIVGANAFLHESGIHQDGILKQNSLYEVIPAAIVGRTPGNLFFGPNSGRNALRVRCESLGVTMTKEQLDRTYELFLGLANDSSGVGDAQLLQIAMRVISSPGLMELAAS